MGAFSDLVKGAVAVPPPAIPAIPAILDPSHTPRLPESPVRQTVADESRARLLRVAEIDGYPEATVHLLPDGELMGCETLSDEGLGAYLLALEASALMNAGIAPAMYHHAARCEKCGPVYLAENQPATVKGCPWCFRRAAGKAIPRPPVTCEGCAHRIPGRLCPVGGMGRCELDATRVFWPFQKHKCGDHKEVGP